MPVFLNLAAAIVATGGVDAPVVIDLTIPQPCAEEDNAVINGEIVVCAEKDRQSRYRLPNPDRQNEKSLPKAEFKLKDGVSLGVETESVDLGMDRAKRVMARIKFKF